MNGYGAVVIVVTVVNVDDFFVGTYWSFADRLYANSGRGHGTYAEARSAIRPNEWFFTCLTSGGAGSSYEVYAATAGDADDGGDTIWWGVGVAE